MESLVLNYWETILTKQVSNLIITLIWSSEQKIMELSVISFQEKLITPVIWPYRLHIQAIMTYSYIVIHIEISAINVNIRMIISRETLLLVITLKHDRTIPSCFKKVVYCTIQTIWIVCWWILLRDKNCWKLMVISLACTPFHVNVYSLVTQICVSLLHMGVYDLMRKSNI